MSADPLRQPPVPESVAELRNILKEAGDIYAARHPHYGDQWRKYGWRGCLYSGRRKIERAWTQLWNKEPEYVKEGEVGGVDDLLDTINYCAMAVMEVRRGNRDGEGIWWQ